MSVPLPATTDDPRQRLLSAAGPIFAAKGFHDATVREICQAAEVNLAAVNYYFGDKERLYTETVKCAHRERIEQVPLPQWPPGISARDKLHGFVLTMLTRMVAPDEAPWHLQLMMREMFQPTAACQELVRDFIRPHHELLLQILDELVPADTPAEQRHLITFSIIGQCLFYRVARPIVSLLVGENEMAGYTPQRLARHITDFSLAPLGGQGHGHPSVRGGTS